MNFYLLADFRLAEAHNTGTVEPLAGAAPSAPKTLPDSNLLHSQNLSGEGEGGRKRAASDTSSSMGSSSSRGDRAGDRTMCCRDITTDQSLGCRGKEVRRRGRERQRPGTTAQGRCKRVMKSVTMTKTLLTTDGTSK